MYTTVIDGEDYAHQAHELPPAACWSTPRAPTPTGTCPCGWARSPGPPARALGALHGLFRVRCFSQDDAHIFMTPDQLKDVIQETVRLFDEVYSTFGLTYAIELSTNA